MDFFEEAVRAFVFGQLKAQGQLGESLSFFIYDTAKVTALLIAAVFIVSIIRTFITREKIKKMLGGKNEGIGNVMAAVLGIPTPFCSCSAVPIFIGFLEAGVPLGITFSFLIASPLINEIAIALLLGLFGWEITVLYIATGLLIAVVSGIIIGRLGMEAEVESYIRKTDGAKQPTYHDWAERAAFAKKQTASITKKVFPYIAIGIAIGAAIHGYVPQDFLAGLAGKNNPLAVPIAVLIGVPLYSNAAGALPIIQALMEKGVATGTALAFMMSITALSIPEMVLLSKVMKPRLLAAFIATLTIAFIITGYLYNFLIK